MKLRYFENFSYAKALKSSFFLLLLIIFILDCALVPGLDSYRTAEIVRGPDFVPYSGLKRRIAILDFENLSGLGDQKLGSAVADQLISQLARSNRYTLIERSRIEKILQEQAFGQSGVITEDTAPEVGKLLGVESLIFGKILEAKQETEKHDIDNEKKKWSLKLKATIGVVHISYKMVSTSTGEILLADDVSTTEIKPGLGIITKDIDLENMFDFDQTVLGIAVRKAVNKIAQDIANHVTQIDWIGKVVQSKADTLVYFTPGRGAGVRLEQLFDVYQTINFGDEYLAVEDSISVDQPKARVKVTGFIGDRVARAKVVQGKNINRGDTVKPVKHQSDINLK